MKIEWLITNVTADRTVAKAESEKKMSDFGPFWPIQVIFVTAKPRCDLEMSS